MKFKFTEQPDPVEKITFNDIKDGDLFQWCNLDSNDSNWSDVYLMTNHLRSDVGQCFNVTGQYPTKFSADEIDYRLTHFRILKIKDIEVVDFIY